MEEECHISEAVVVICVSHFYFKRGDLVEPPGQTFDCAGGEIFGKLITIKTVLKGLEVPNNSGEVNINWVNDIAIIVKLQIRLLANSWEFLQELCWLKSFPIVNFRLSVQNF